MWLFLLYKNPIVIVKELKFVTDSITKFIFVNKIPTITEMLDNESI